MPLTTVDSHQVEVGRTAARVLLDLVDGDSPSSLRLEPALVVRSSTAPVGA